MYVAKHTGKKKGVKSFTPLKTYHMEQKYTKTEKREEEKKKGVEGSVIGDRARFQTSGKRLRVGHNKFRVV